MNKLLLLIGGLFLLLPGLCLGLDKQFLSLETNIEDLKSGTTSFSYGFNINKLNQLYIGIRISSDDEKQDYATGKDYKYKRDIYNYTLGYRFYFNANTINKSQTLDKLRLFTDLSLGYSENKYKSDSLSHTTYTTHYYAYIGYEYMLSNNLSIINKLGFKYSDSSYLNDSGVNQDSKNYKLPIVTIGFNYYF